MNGIGNIASLFHSGVQLGQSDEVGQTQSARGNADANGIGSSKQDRTTVSSLSSGLHTALAGDDVRTDVVARLQAAIANGSYNVSSSDVADKLIASMQAQR